MKNPKRISDLEEKPMNLEEKPMEIGYTQKEGGELDELKEISVPAKTREEVEKLKLDWAWDPHWKLEKTPGFEDYAKELLTFRTEQEALWEKGKAERIVKEMEEWGIRPFNATKLHSMVSHLKANIKVF